MARQTRSYSNLDAADDTQHWVQLMREFPERSPQTVAMRQVMHDWLLEKPGYHVLDIGCGTGDAAYEVSQCLPCVQVIAMDFSQAMIDFAEQHNGADNIRFEQGDVTQLQFEDEQFDSIRIERVLHHVENIDQAFSEIQRVLKPGGRVVINEPDFTLMRVYPLSNDLNHEYGKRYARTNANGDIGARLHALMHESGLKVLQYQASLYVVKDYAWLRRSCQAVSVLEEMLDELGHVAIMQEVEKASKEGTFLWAPCGVTIMAEKTGP